MEGEAWEKVISVPATILTSGRPASQPQQDQGGLLGWVYCEARAVQLAGAGCGFSDLWDRPSTLYKVHEQQQSPFFQFEVAPLSQAGTRLSRGPERSVP